MMSVFYTIVDNKQYDYLLKYDYVPFTNEDEADERMNNWMLLQMKKMLPSHLFETTEEKTNNTIGPHWLFVNMDDIWWEILTEDRILLEIVKNQTDCLFFDDSDWVSVANNIKNNDCYSYLAHSQQEADANANATPEKIKESWGKIFRTVPTFADVSRDDEYCGDLSVRAVTPFIHKNDVIKIIQH